VEFLSELREQLKSRLDARSALVEEIEGLLAVPTAEARDMNSTETEEFDIKRGEIAAMDEEIAELRSAIEEKTNMHESLEEARAAAPAGESMDVTEGRVEVKKSELTYRQGGDFSYFRDLALASAPGRFDGEARERLVRHGEEMKIEQRVTPNRTDGQLGEFVPPAWLINSFVATARAGRVTADLCQKIELPAGTDSIQIPKISGGSTVAAQTDNGPVSNTDMTTSTVSAPVNTYAGQQIMSIQLLEQSPVSGGLDQVIFQDLIQAHAQTIGAAVVGGAGTSGAHTGLLTATSTTITYTATSPTASGVYQAIAQGISNVAKSRFLPANAVVMNPSRWYWLVSQVDSNGRPFVVPSVGGPFNAAGVMDVADAQGAVGTIAGVPVYLDPNIGSTYSTNQDRVIVGRFSDSVLMEGPLRSRVLFETDASTLSVRLQVWNYSAYTQTARYTSAFAVCSGTGFAAPSGY
jgi:HK97 family phage major capsid protein